MASANPIVDKNTTENILQQNDLIFVSSSMQGWRIDMEDVHIIENNIPDFPGYSFFGVYDGHLGKETSEYLGENLHVNIFKKIHEVGEENIENAIKDAFMQTDNDWNVKSDSGTSGSTAVIAIKTPNDIVYIGNAGDSRAVMSVAGLAIPLSEDHKPSLVREAGRIIQAGGDPDGVNLTRAFGNFKRCKNNPNKGPEEQIFIALPDINSHKIDTETDFLVLACDGIWDCMSSQQVIDFIIKDIKLNKDLSKACENLMDQCLAKVFCGIGTDNMTIIIVGFLHGLEKEKWLERISNRCINEENN
ncbi:phosphatase 2C-like domain-containing protein [Glomus cerebriforme]|uniref:protein-serine/threonine phosphatase n=1 Tax=Glomus cerebriforme TaxID=658196 RepID=A0A397T6G9_9GLOM|nr:phosphatase 2C-like domain-containing protein [Glomus cerebriforme]